MAEIVENILNEDGIGDVVVKKDIKTQLLNLGIQRGIDRKSVV